MSSGNPTGYSVGQRVMPGSSHLRSLRDYWLRCGREPQKGGAKAAMEAAEGRRGSVQAIHQGNSAWILTVLWDDGTVSQCTSAGVQAAGGAA